MSLWNAATDNERDILESALNALQHSAGFMSAIDVSNAEANISEVRYRPLTTLAIEAATGLASLFPAGPTEANVGRVPAEVHEIR